MLGGFYRRVLLAMLAILSGCVAQSARGLPPSAGIATVQPGSLPSGDFLFVNAGCGVPPDSGICIFTYPAGVYVGWIDHYEGTRAQALCSDALGNVYVTSVITRGYAGAVLKYGHAGNGPLAILDDGRYQPGGCAVDPGSGDLAVANVSHGKMAGSVALYTAAQGRPAFHRMQGIFSYDFCGYDDGGNLYVTGMSKNGATVLAVLLKGKHAFAKVSLDKPLATPGPVQWDGKHLAIGYGDLKHSLVYRVQVTGSQGRVVATTQVSVPHDVKAAMGPFWIEDKRIIATFKATDSYPVGIWRYPQGGSPKSVIRHGRRVNGQGTATVSVMPSP